MKKLNLISTILIVAGAVSCNNNIVEPVVEAQEEITFSPVATSETNPDVKSPIEGRVFPDDRVIYLSATISNDEGLTDYFEGKTFKKADDGRWHNFEGNELSPIYKPIGYDINYLAYSTSKDISADNVAWGTYFNNPKNVASCLTINYPDNYMYYQGVEKGTQDDILFSSTVNMTQSSEIIGLLNADFRHAQAWLNFSVKTDDPETVVHSISLERAYTSGLLIVENQRAFVNAYWNFADAEKRERFVLNFVDDETVNTVASRNITATDDYYPVGDMGMLIPEQSRCRIKIVYTYKGVKKTAYTDHNNFDVWYMGKKYDYKFYIGELPGTGEDMKFTVTVRAWNDVVAYEQRVVIE